MQVRVSVSALVPRRMSSYPHYIQYVLFDHVGISGSGLHSVGVAHFIVRLATWRGLGDVEV